MTNRYPARPAVLATILLLALLATATAQAPRLSGRTEATFGLAADGGLPVASTQLELRLDGEVGSGFFPDAAYTATARAAYDAATGATTFELDEAYTTLYFDDLEVAIGKQRRSWGSTDGVNPVDALNPRDLTFPPANDKLAVPMLSGTLHSGEARVQLGIVPLFTPSRLPGAAWRAPLTPELPPGVTLVGDLPPETHEPEAALSNVQFGVRATLDLGSVDVSTTYFSGFRTQPTASARLVPTAAPGQFRLQPVLRCDRVQLLGLDFSATVGDLVLRGEAAYQFSADPTGTDAGEEADVAFKALTVMTYQPGVRTRVDLAWLQSLDGSGLVKPTAAYTLADGVVSEATAYVFYGAAGSEFGDWQENSQLRLSVAYAF